MLTFWLFCFSIRITYFMDPMDRMYMTVPGGDNGGAVVTGLMAETSYSFSLAVITPDGTGEAVATATETTLPPTSMYF